MRTQLSQTARAVAAVGALVLFLVASGWLWIAIDMSTGFVPVDAMNHESDDRGG